MHQFLKFIFGITLYIFWTVPLSIIRSFSLYPQQWHMTYRFANSLQAGSGRNCSSILILLASCQQTRESSASGSAPGLPSGKQDRFVFPFTVPCVRLSSDHWLLWGKVKCKGVAPSFPFGFRILC